MVSGSSEKIVNTHNASKSQVMNELKSTFDLSRWLTRGTILVFVLWSAAYSMTAAINIPTSHLDGAFQTASGLFRIDSGHIPGKDFLPYLGVWYLLALYPAFKLFGSDLSASVFSAQLMTLMAAWVSVSLIWHLIFRPKSFITSLAAGAVFFATPVGIASYFSLPLPQPLEFSAHPGTSLRSMRTAAPYLMAIIHYFLISNIKSMKSSLVASGTVTGAALLWSNDFAFPSAGLFALLIACSLVMKREFKPKNILLYFFSAFSSWVILLGLISLGHPLALLKYNFIDVAKDQWWFFGPYGESARIFNLQQIHKLISKQTILPLAILVLAIIAASRTRRIEHMLIAWIGAVLLAGGVLASIGGHLGSYFRGFCFWGLVTLAFTILRLAHLRMKRAFELNNRSSQTIGLFAVAISFLISFSLSIHAWWSYKSTLSMARNDASRFYVPELGGYLGSEWRDYIDLARQTNTKRIMEEYWGLWSATRKILPAWPVDSVIHALGRTRQVAMEKLENAEIIISTRSSKSPEWQPWSVSQNFWFYDELLNNWSPYEMSPTTIVWRKNDKLRVHESIECRPGHDGHSLVLGSTGPGFYKVEMEYSFHGNGRYLLMVRNNLSFGTDAGGRVSIDPNGNKAKFPAYISQAKETALQIYVSGNDQYDLTINKCVSSKIEPVRSEVLYIPDPIDSSLSLKDRKLH